MAKDPQKSMADIFKEFSQNASSGFSATSQDNENQAKAAAQSARAEFEAAKKGNQDAYKEFRESAKARVGAAAQSNEGTLSGADKDFKARVEAFDKRVEAKMAQAVEQAKDSISKEPSGKVISVENAEKKLAEAKARLNEQGVTPPAPKVEGVEHKTDKGYSYTVTENGVTYNNSLKDRAVVRNLEPRTYVVADNGKGKSVAVYGGVVAGNVDAARITGQNELKRIAIEHEIYNDIVKRGDNSAGAAAFKENHKKDMEAWGLSVANGRLYQTNPNSMSGGYTEVKNMKDLEKKVADHKKDAKENNPLMKRILQMNQNQN